MISVLTWTICAILSAVFAALLSAASLPLLGVLQQEGYGGRAFLRWYYRRGNLLCKRYTLLALSLVSLGALFALCFSFAGAEIAVLLGAFAYAAVCALFLFASRRALKVPLRFTRRAVRLFVCYALLLLAAVFGAETGLSFAAEAIGTDLARLLLRTAPMGLMPFLLPVLLFLAGTLMKGFEIPHERAFERRAAAALAASPCVKAGVTGSFGKTSVKRFAEQILSSRFRVIATPASFNTPSGVARTVNGTGCDCDVFLAEMGARRTGDIGELCDMVRPTAGVVTGVCPQHLETFGSIEAIVREKGELARAVQRPVLGASAAMMDREGALLEGRDFGAENVVCGTDGIRFDLFLGGKRFPVRSPLLGRHAAEDLALASALCLTLGMEAEEIAAALPLVESVPHRLQKLESGGVTVLDDSYNANPAGAEEAVRVLRLFGGKKYAVTPGIVELGALEESGNNALGALLAGLDGVILVGETLVLAVRRGYLAAGGDEAKLRVVPTLDGAKDILAAELGAGDCVLFLNDLPDKYL